MPATQEPIVAPAEGSAEDPGVDRRLGACLGRNGSQGPSDGADRVGWPDAGLPLLLVAFARAREPSRLLHESLIVGESLAEGEYRRPTGRLRAREALWKAGAPYAVAGISVSVRHASCRQFHTGESFYRTPTALWIPSILASFPPLALGTKGALFLPRSRLS